MVPANLAGLLRSQWEHFSQAPHWLQGHVEEGKGICVYTGIRDNTHICLSSVSCGFSQKNDEWSTYHLCLANPCFQNTPEIPVFHVSVEEEFSLNTAQASCNCFIDGCRVDPRFQNLKIAPSFSAISPHLQWRKLRGMIFLTEA